VKKVTALLEYLYKSSQFEEWDTIFKLAHKQTGEEYLKNYPNIFAAFETDNKRAGAWISLLKQLERSGLSEDKLKQLEVSSFDSLKEMLVNLKDISSQSKKQDLYSGIKSKNLTEEVKSILELFKPSKEDIIYILDQKNHTATQRAVMLKDLYDQKPKIKEIYPDFNLEVNTYLNENNEPDIDVAIKEFNDAMFSESSSEQSERLERFYDFIWNGPREGVDYEGYEKTVPMGAKNNSEIVYVGKEHTVVHSWSREAVQYWEKGAVQLTNGGSPAFYTCTSRIYGPEGFLNTNMFDGYSRYDIYQIISNSAISNGKPVFFNYANNKPNHLFTACFDMDGSLVEGGDKTVNAKDEAVYYYGIKEHVEELDEILEVISGRLSFNKLNQLSQGFGRDREVQNRAFKGFLKKYGKEKIYDFMVKNITFEKYFEALKNDEVSLCIVNMQKYCSSEEFEYFANNLIQKTSPYEYFTLRAYKAEGMSFTQKLQKDFPEVKYILSKFADKDLFVKKLEDISPVECFDLSLENLIQNPTSMENPYYTVDGLEYLKDEMLNIIDQKAKELPPTYFIGEQIYIKYPEYVEEKIMNVNADKFFEMPFLPSDTFPRKVKEALKMSSINDENIIKTLFKELLEQKIREMSPSLYFDCITKSHSIDSFIFQRENSKPNFIEAIFSENFSPVYDVVEGVFEKKLANLTNDNFLIIFSKIKKSSINNPLSKRALNAILNPKNKYLNYFKAIDLDGLLSNFYDFFKEEVKDLAAKTIFFNIVDEKINKIEDLDVYLKYVYNKYVSSKSQVINKLKEADFFEFYRIFIDDPDGELILMKLNLSNEEIKSLFETYEKKAEEKPEDMLWLKEEEILSAPDIFVSFYENMRSLYPESTRKVMYNVNALLYRSFRASKDNTHINHHYDYVDNNFLLEENKEKFHEIITQYFIDSLNSQNSKTPSFFLSLVIPPSDEVKDALFDHLKEYSADDILFFLEGNFLKQYFERFDEDNRVENLFKEKIKKMSADFILENYHQIRSAINRGTISKEDYEEILIPRVKKELDTIDVKEALKKGIHLMVSLYNTSFLDRVTFEDLIVVWDAIENGRAPLVESVTTEGDLKDTSLLKYFKNVFAKKFAREMFSDLEFKNAFINSMDFEGVIDIELYDDAVIKYAVKNFARHWKKAMTFFQDERVIELLWDEFEHLGGFSHIDPDAEEPSVITRGDPPNRVGVQDLSSMLSQFSEGVKDQDNENKNKSSEVTFDEEEPTTDIDAPEETTFEEEDNE